MIRANLTKFLSSLYVIIFFVVFGAGCFDAPTVSQESTEAKSDVSGIPMLDITSPELITTTTEENIQIKGNTDQDKVYINDVPFEVFGGDFSVLTILEQGEHKIPVSVGNGLTTTTITLLITRE